MRIGDVLRESNHHAGHKFYYKNRHGKFPSLTNCYKKKTVMVYSLLLTNCSTSFPGLQCEDEARHEEALAWTGQFCILIG